jgi:gamma-D-glutamyl-L-lysine dipeptidyl-peptidase
MTGSLGEHTFARHLAAVRSEPRSDAEQVTQVLAGEPVTVEEEQGGWARVRTSYDYAGWIRIEDLGGSEDAKWLQTRAKDPTEWARDLVGKTPYEWGGMTPAGIDCSGLVHMGFRATGRLVPRDADQQEDAGTPVEEPRAGDLVTYGDPGKPADHVAFWVGEGRILHSTSREGADGVVEEAEPDELRVRRRGVFRL